MSILARRSDSLKIYEKKETNTNDLSDISDNGNINITSHRGSYTKNKKYIKNKTEQTNSDDDHEDMPNLTLQVQNNSVDEIQKLEVNNSNQITFANAVKSQKENSSDETEKHQDEKTWTVVQKKKRTKPGLKTVVGTSKASSELTGVKKAWLHLGKLKEGTEIQNVNTFLEKYFPGMDITVTKLESKGRNCSFRLGVDFDLKDEIMNSEHWPRNVTLRRFLFRRSGAELPN
ncbi:hypothetical protein O3M35_012992 [Rhynocoris fuscipes]|uniref:Uncharacterized protein n=1 Tax=Rhynocoris fuscipes TaxID=488301 RepID=A0AAW1CHG9_9HEMI